MFKTSGTMEESFDRMEVEESVQVWPDDSIFSSREAKVAFLRAADTFLCGAMCVRVLEDFPRSYWQVIKKNK